MKKLILIILGAPLIVAAQAKKNVSAKPQPAVTPTVKADDKVEMKPGSLQKKVHETATSLKTAKTNEERVQLLTALEKLVEADADKATIEGVRYSVALEPVFDNRRTLNEKKICEDTRGDILQRFTSGTGNTGKIPYFVKDALEVLASACQDDSLEADD